MTSLRSRLFLAGISLLIAVVFSYALYAYANAKSTEKKITDDYPTPTIELSRFTPTPSIIVSSTQSSSNSQASSVWYVSPLGNDESAGTSPEKALATIQKALDLATPGAVINLLPGIYKQDIISKSDGLADAPITITGTHDAVVQGAGASRVIEINHDYIVLDGFTVDGEHSEAVSDESYRDKLIYAQGKGERNGVDGLKIINMIIRNAGGECIRLRYYAQNNEIAYNHIVNCGINDFLFDEGGKNGEGIYIGTAPEQRKDGKNPTPDNDESNNNWIHHNIFNTQGNECVDIKENSKYNIVENNKCTGQKDTESGGMESRGGYNTFRYNEIFGNKGAGVRLGGDTVGENINNEVYENTIRDNKSGGIKIMTSPQGKMCGNVMLGNDKGNTTGEYAEDYNPIKSC